MLRRYRGIMVCGPGRTFVGNKYRQEGRSWNRHILKCVTEV
jgi:hypothetical protein